MPSFSAQQLQTLTAGSWLGGRLPAGAVSGFTQDTRLLKAGMCFVALQTAQRDGHAFLPAALAVGASMALVARGNSDCPLPQLVVADPLRAFQKIATAHRLTFDGKVIGVTGSCGKTSTKNILQALLGERCHATKGNLNNFIGVPLTLLALETAADKENATGGDQENTTVAAEDLPQFAVIEAGISEPGEMAVLAEMIRPDIALVTMVGAAHLQDLGSIENVAAEKSVLAQAQNALGAEDIFTAHPAAAQHLPLLFAPLECWSYPAFAALPNAGVAVTRFESDENAEHFEWVLPDDERGDGNDALRKQLAQEAAQMYSDASRAKEKAEQAALEAALPQGVLLHRYALEYLDEPQAGADVFLSIVGERLSARFALGFNPSFGMASNLALALVAAHTLGVPVDLLAARVRDWRPSGNRGQWLQGGGKQFYVDCYNANPDSMSDALSHFTSTLTFGDTGVRAKPRLYVIGGMRELGADSALWHKRLGLSLGVQVSGAKRGDVVVTIGQKADNLALEAGIRVYAPQATVHCFNETQEAQPLVDAFHGVVFLKGSRFYALESLLPKQGEPS